MKRLISITLFVLVLLSLSVPAFAESPNVEKIEDDPDKNEILAISDEIIEWVNQAIDDENKEKQFTKMDSLPHITTDDIDFSKMYKNYGDGDHILDAQSNEEILDILDNLYYTWMLLVYVEDIVIELQLDKNFDFEGYDNVSDMTYEEMKAIIKEKGSYGIDYMGILEDDTFYTSSIANGKMTYFVSLPSAGTIGAIQFIGNKCNILCESGEAKNIYVNIDRIEPKSTIANPGPGVLGGSRTYTLTDPAFPSEIIIVSCSVALVAAVIVFVIFVRKSKKAEN